MKLVFKVGFALLLSLGNTTHSASVTPEEVAAKAAEDCCGAVPVEAGSRQSDFPPPMHE